MAGKAQELGGQIRVADYLSFGLLARLVPPSLVDQVLAEQGRHSQRQRDLPAHAVAYYGKTFGVPGTQQGRGYPQLRFTGLVENGTHLLFGLTLGAYSESEMSLASQTVKQLQPGMLCLADRGLSGYPLWAQAYKTGAHLLWRVTKNRKLPVLERLSDGSYLSEIEPAKATRRTLADPHAPALTVRVIDYHLPGAAQAQAIYRLITTLLNPDEAPAKELAALYQARWTIESTFAEIKTTLKGADVVLRSKTPELVRQEFWGLLLAHYVVRKLMLEAALTRSRSPDQLSFKHSLTLIRRKLPVSGALPS